jgi:hypothetical protein
MSRFPKTDLEAWREWKERCAIALCGENAHANLAAYGEAVFSKCWHKYASGVGLPFQSRAEGWQLFESYMHTESGKTGKRWKDWLFERAQNSSDDFVTVLEKVTYACMRTAVAKYCTDEGHLKASKSGFRLASWDAPLTNASDSKTTTGDVYLGPAWENPSQIAEWNELREIARKEAAELFNKLDQKSKTALLADCLDISLAARAVVALAGKEKSALYDSLPNIMKQAESHLRDTYSPEDARTLQALIALTKEALHEVSFLWGKSEKSAQPLFTLYSNRMNS